MAASGGSGAQEILALIWEFIVEEQSFEVILYIIVLIIGLLVPTFPA